MIDQVGRRQHRRLARAVDLVEEADAATLDVALLVGVAGSVCSRAVDHPSLTVIATSARATRRSSRGAPGAPARFRQPVEHDPLVERVDERDQRLERDVEPELGADGRKGLAQDGTPLRVYPHEPLAELGPVPGQGLQLEPDLLVRTILVEVGHRRPPLLDERHVRRVHLPLPLDQPLGEALEHAYEQLLHRPK